MKTHHVIYVPGLGDMKAQGQELVVRLWHLLGVQGHYAPVHWADKEPWEPKLERLLALIDELSKTGDVSLVGTSAGASAVLFAYAQRTDVVRGVVCVCGKINHPETVNPHLYEVNPAFKESMVALQRALPKLDAAARARILSTHSLRDGTVPPADTIIPGAHERTIFAAGHAFSILCALLFGAPGMMRFLKRQPSPNRNLQKNSTSGMI